MLEGRNISYTRDTSPLFSNLSFCLKHGEILKIKGANGSGKSTFLRLLTGLLPPKTDKLFWNGGMVSKKNLSSYQQNLLYMGHKLCLYPEIRVEDQLHLWHTLYKIPKQSLEQALEKWGLSSFQHKKISHLSQGQQKRLALTRCCWLKRPLWILDEPKSALDQTGQQHLETLLTTHVKEGGMVVLATHEWDKNPSPAHSQSSFKTSPPRREVSLPYEKPSLLGNEMSHELPIPSPLVEEGAPSGQVREKSSFPTHEITL